MMLKGGLSDRAYIRRGTPAARIHPSSIDHPMARGITKAVVMEGSCTFSRPSGKLSIRLFQETRQDIDAHFFTLFSPISTLQIREFWIGQRTTYGPSNNHTTSWKQTATGLRRTFEVLTYVEGLTIVRCKMELFLQILGETVHGRILLPGL